MSANAMKVDTGRQEQLQFLRFLAFLNIFLYHGESWLFFPYPISASAWAAVSFFFMLSGLVMGLAYHGREIRLGIRPMGTFLWKRLKKLYPLYFAMTIFMILYSGLPGAVAVHGIAAEKAELTQVMRNFLLLQSWFKEGYYSYNGVGWFLSSVMFLYVLTLPAMVVLNRIDKHPKRYVIFLILMGGCLFLSAVFCYLTKDWDMEYWHYIFPPARMGEYFAGMILGVMMRTLKPRLKQGQLLRMVFTVLELGVLFCWVRALSSPGNYWRNHIVSWLIPNMAVLSVFSIGSGWVSTLFRKPLPVRLGNASFECYLIHQIVIVLYNVSNPGLDQTQNGKVLSLTVCLMASVIFALLLCPGQKKRQAACT